MEAEGPTGMAGPPTAVPPIVNFGDQRLPSIRAGHRRVRAPATNAGTVGPGLVSWIQLDTSQLGAFLDPHNSYLEFKFKFTGMKYANYRGTGTVEPTSSGTDANQYGVRTYALLSNAGAASFIDTMRLYVQGNCVGELQDYGAAQELMCDFNGNGQYVYTPPIKGEATGADADNRWDRGTFLTTSGAPSTADLDTLSAFTIPERGQHFPTSQSPYDFGDPGLKLGKDKGAHANLGYKLGRPRTFDSMLLHQNRLCGPQIIPQDDTSDGGLKTEDSLTFTACVPTLSSFIGTFARKAFPLLEFAPGSVQIQIVWAQQYVPFYAMKAFAYGGDQSANAASPWYPISRPAQWAFPRDPAQSGSDTDLANISWEISEINFVHKVIVMPAEVAGVIMSRQAQADTTLRVQELRHYILPRLSTSSKTYNLIVPAKIQSASAMYLTFRPENLNVYNKFSTCRYNPGFWAHSGSIKVQCRIGSEYVPTQAITTGPELFAETIKAINKLSSTAGETLLDDAHYYGHLDSNTGPGYLHRRTNVTASFPSETITSTSEDGFHKLYVNKQCVFCIGIDFDAFSGSTDTTRSGMFLGNNTMTVELVMNTLPGENYTCDAWFLNDGELVVRSTGVAIWYY